MQFLSSMNLSTWAAAWLAGWLAGSRSSLYFNYQPAQAQCLRLSMGGSDRLWSTMVDHQWSFGLKHIRSSLFSFEKFWIGPSPLFIFDPSSTLDCTQAYTVCNKANVRSHFGSIHFLLKFIDSIACQLERSDGYLIPVFRIWRSTVDALLQLLRSLLQYSGCWYYSLSSVSSGPSVLDLAVYSGRLVTVLEPFREELREELHLLTCISCH